MYACVCVYASAYLTCVGVYSFRAHASYLTHANSYTCIQINVHTYICM